MQDSQDMAQRVSQWIAAKIQPLVTSNDEDLGASLTAQAEILQSAGEKMRKKLLEIAAALASRSPNGAPADIGVTEVPRLAYQMDMARKNAATLLEKLAATLEGLQNRAEAQVKFNKQIITNQQLEAIH